MASWNKLNIHRRSIRAIIVMVVLGVAVVIGMVLAASFSWDVGAPLLSAKADDQNHYFSVTDPSVVRYDGKWQLFCTVRGKERPAQIEYLSFDRWDNAGKAQRRLLRSREGYASAPEVFFFRPAKKWYMIYQVNEPGRKIRLQPAYSTTKDITDPKSWTKAKLLFPEGTPKGVRSWIDFWVVCDAEKAYLFFTSQDGGLWRMWTPIKKFPNGFGHLERALQADICESAHVYRLAGPTKYLTVVEAQGKGGRRYCKAYVTDRLDGKWTPLADKEDQPFAGAANVRQSVPPWADSISHGEIIRATYDETLTVDPNNLQFLFQGVSDKARAGKRNSEIPWRLGLLTHRHD